MAVFRQTAVGNKYELGMKIKALSLLILTLSLNSCFMREEFGNESLIGKIEETDWNRITSSPEALNNDTILVRGKFKLYFENSTIINSDSLGIWIEPGNWDEITYREYENLINKNILVIGKFSSIDRGHLSQHLGSITEIYYLKKE